MAKLRRKGHPVAPVTIEGRTIARTFWGKAWCENLESYHDYENRLPRGRTYVRNGSVVDLQIAPLEVKALVSGSSIYTVTVSIKAMPKAQWQSLCRDCTGGIDSLVELLQGRFSKGVMERLCRQDTGLFPKPSEIRFSCSCPDSASMCKHVAAVLYGVGARLDEQPELLFHLRAVDHGDLDTAMPLSTASPAAGKVLDAEDVAALFGLEMAGEESPVRSGSGSVPDPTPASTRQGRTGARPAKRTTGRKREKAGAPEPDVSKAVKLPAAKPARTPVPDAGQPPRRRKRGAVWDPSDIYEA